MSNLAEYAWQTDPFARNPLPQPLASAPVATPVDDKLVIAAAPPTPAPTAEAPISEPAAPAAEAVQP